MEKPESIEAQSDTEHTTESQKRYRRKSVRRQLQDVVMQLGKAANDPHQKPAKKIDALLRQSEVLLRLQGMDAEDRDQSLQEENAALGAQHAADAQRIQELETQSVALKSHRCQVMTRVEPDPQHKTIRAERDTLRAVVKFLAGVAANREQKAIRALQQLPADVASLVCDAVGIKFGEYRQYLSSYRSERDLLNVIEKAQVDDTPLLRFVRAALAVNHSLNLDAPRPKSEAARLHSVQEELIELERQENADRQATMNIDWRRQMGL